MQFQQHWTDYQRATGRESSAIRPQRPVEWMPAYNRISLANRGKSVSDMLAEDLPLLPVISLRSRANACANDPSIGCPRAGSFLCIANCMAAAGLHKFPGLPVSTHQSRKHGRNPCMVPSTALQHCPVDLPTVGCPSSPFLDVRRQEIRSAIGFRCLRRQPHALSRKQEFGAPMPSWSVRQEMSQVRLQGSMFSPQPFPTSIERHADCTSHSSQSGAATPGFEFQNWPARCQFADLTMVVRRSGSSVQGHDFGPAFGSEPVRARSPPCCRGRLRSGCLVVSTLRIRPPRTGTKYAGASQDGMDVIEMRTSPIDPLRLSFGISVPHPMLL